MPFAAIIIGAIIIVAAFNNTHSQLAAELENDIPGYFKWAIAIAAILGLGLIPGLSKPSRWLFALVVVVIVVTNYQAIVAGFKGFALSSGQPSAPAPSPATSGSAGSGGSPLAILNPTELAGLASGFGGALGAV